MTTADPVGYELGAFRLPPWMEEFALLGILQTDANLIVQGWNRWLEDKSGLGAADVIGRHLFEVQPTLIERHMNRYYREALAGHIARLSVRLHRYLLPLPTPGEHSEFALMLQEAWIGPIWDSGHIIGTVTLIEDVTERVLREGELIRAQKSAEAANQAKNDFLANMSHEIRTPMTAILGYADLMLEENVGRATREHVEVIKRNGMHLLEIINDILDLSKVEAGKMQMEPIHCSPCQLVADVALLMRVRATEKQLTLKTELRYPLPETMFTDSLRLRQILVNLVGNAIKFTDHGEVRITAQLTQVCGLPRLRFDVTDTGIGMSEEQVKNLFQPFTQVDSSSTRKFGGTGLGLCICKRLAEALGGNIKVCSALGKGSIFSVTIDPGSLDGIRMLEEGQDAAVRSTTISAPADGTKIGVFGRVLLAEDGLDNQRLICMLLRKAGADVVAVENGQLAIKTAMAAYELGEPFDIILMDMQMPVMDGYSATRRLREWKYPGPIVALTAHAMDQDCQKCLDAGCDDYATKPINRQTFLATVAHWIVRGKAHRTAPSSPQNVSTGWCPAL